MAIVTMTVVVVVVIMMTKMMVVMTMMITEALRIFILVSGIWSCIYVDNSM
jgi:hypothetical protein